MSAVADIPVAPSVADRYEALIDGAGADVWRVLDDGLRTGRFCGIAQTDPGAGALVEMLRLRGQRIDPARFAGAVPHFPERFGLAEIRATLANLGIQTALRTVKGSDLGSLPAGSAILRSDGSFGFVVRPPGDAAPVLQVPARDARLRITPWRSYRCLVPLSRVQADSRADGAARIGWLGQTVQSVSAETAMLLGLTLVSNLLLVVAAMSVTFVFNAVIPSGARDTLLALVAGLLLLLALDLRVRRAKARLVARVAGRLDYHVSRALFGKLVSLPLGMLTAAPISDQMTRLRQFETVRDLYAGPIVAVLFELPFVAAMLLGLVLLDPAVGLTLTAAVALRAGIGMLVFPRIRRASAEMVGLRDRCQRLQEETLSQRDQIITRGLGARWSARLAPRYAELSRARRRVEGVWRLLTTLVVVLAPLCIGAVVMVGALRVMAGAMSGGALVACMILATRMLSPVQQALLLAVRTPELLSLIRQIAAMMRLPDTGPGARGRPEVRLAPPSRAPAVGFDRVVLRHGAGAVTALRGVSFVAGAGSFTAISGTSGSGKSALLQAASGLYRVQGGKVLIGTSNIDQLGHAERTARIAHVGHDPLQFHGTLAQNLALTAPAASRAEMLAVCERLGLGPDLAALPLGLDTPFGPGSDAPFSAAFPIRFAIAQALLKRPHVLLLDEPETALSPQDERRLIEVIRSGDPAMTVLMVTQRPSLMRRADRVVLLHDGAITYSGPPEGLPQKGP